MSATLSDSGDFDAARSGFHLLDAPDPSATPTASAAAAAAADAADSVHRADVDADTPLALVADPEALAAAALAQPTLTLPGNDVAGESRGVRGEALRARLDAVRLRAGGEPLAGTLLVTNYRIRFVAR